MEKKTLMKEVVSPIWKGYRGLNDFYYVELCTNLNRNLQIKTFCKFSTVETYQGFLEKVNGWNYQAALSAQIINEYQIFYNYYVIDEDQFNRMTIDLDNPEN